MSETGTTTLTIDQAAALSAGTRTCAGIAGVDSATMMIATDWPADTDAAMDALMTARHAALGDGT